MSVTSLGQAMPLNLTHIDYANLKPRQQENYNYQKLSSVLADYGFVTLRLSDDWQGADFIAQHIDGETFLRVQLKGRFTLSKRYIDKQLYIAFPDGEDWYMYSHDELLDQVSNDSNLKNTNYWQADEDHKPPSLTKKMRYILAPCKIISKSREIAPVNATPDK